MHINAKFMGIALQEEFLTMNDLRPEMNERLPFGYDDDDQLPERKRVKKHRPLALGFLIVAVVMFIAVVLYAYSQGQNEGVNGTTPMVKAEDSPTKVRPENPGGMEIPNRDKLIYENMGDGQALEQKEQVLAQQPEEPVIPGSAPEMSQQTMQPAQYEALNPLAVAPVEKTAEPVMAAPAVEKEVVETPAIEELKPVAPAPVVEKMQEPVVKATPKKVTQPFEAPAVVQSAYYVQLLSVQSEEDAVAAWPKIQTKHAGILGDASLSVQKADLGAKGIYYRVRAAGFDSKETATQACDQLKQAGQGCLVVSK